MKNRPQPFPWLMLLFLIGSIAAFWYLPIRIGTPEIRVNNFKK